MPPLIVESLQTITHSRPSMRPMPVMSPAPWMASSYMPLAASGDSSKRRARIDELHHALARQQLAARHVTFARARQAAFGRFVAPPHELVHQRAHLCSVGAELLGIRIDLDSIGKAIPPGDALYASRVSRMNGPSDWNKHELEETFGTSMLACPFSP